MKLKRVLFWFGAATLFAAASLLVLIQIDSLQQWTLRRVEKLAASAGISFSAQHIHFDLFRLRAVLDNVAYADKEMNLRAGHVNVDLPWNIFTSSIKVITDLEVENLQIGITSSEPVLPEPSGKPTPLPKIRFDRLVVRKGSLDYRNQSMQFRIPAFSIDVAKGGGIVRFDQPLSLPPDARVELREIHVTVVEDGFQFDPAEWKAHYTEYDATGNVSGQLKWTPAFFAGMQFSTNPVAIRQWKGIRASGKVELDKGVLRISEFRAQQGAGQVNATAEISDKKKSLAATWSALRLDPAGFEGTTNGSIQMDWNASDFSDVQGSGAAFISSVRIGRARSDIQIRKARAFLKITAEPPDTLLTANIQTGLDKKVTGTFQANYHKYGPVILAGDIRGTWNAPVVQATAEARDIAYRGVGPVNGSAQVSLRNEVISVTDIRAGMKRSGFENAFITINLNTKQVQGQIPNIDIHIEDLASGAKGTATGSAMLGGSIDHPSAEFSAYSAGLDYGGTHIDSASIAGQFANDMVTLEKIEATQAEGRLNAQGFLNVNTRAMHADVDIENLMLRDIHGLSTTAFLRGTVDGTPDMPSTNFSGDLREVVYEGEAHGNLALTGTTSGTTATIQASSDKYSANLVSKVELRTPYSFTSVITANQSRVRHQQYDVVLTGKAEAAGQARPFKVTELSLQSLTLNGNGIDLKANGSLQDGILADVSADLSRLPVDGVDGIDGAVLTGGAMAHTVLTGTVENPMINGSIETTNATIKTPRMTEPLAFTANVDFKQDQIEIRNMRADIAGGSVEVQGHGKIKGPYALEFHAAEIHPEALISNRPVYGSISANGTATLAEPSMKGAEAAVVVSQLDLFVRDTPVRQAEPVRLSLKNGTLTIVSFRLEGGDTRAELRGSANIESGALQFDLQADTNLQVLEAFVPDSSVTGKIQTEASIRGTTSQPSINGFIHIADTQFQMANPPVELSGLNVQIDLQGDRLEIRQASASLNGGQFTASGKAGYSVKGLRDSTLTIHAKGVQLEYPEGFQSEINSELQLAESDSYTTIEGSVDIVSALYRDDIDLSQELFAKITNASDGSTGFIPRSQAGFADHIGLDMTVRTPGLVTVSNNVADLDLTGTFQVRGTLRDPVVLGRAAVNDGGELYFGPGIARDAPASSLERRDRYVINRGTIEFDNVLHTEPNFDLEAVHELQVKDERYLITLTATGTPSNLKTEFTSDPYLAEPDIIAMLLTGRTFEDLQGAHLAVAREQVANYLTGQMSGFFNTAGTALGLDTVRIDAVSLASDEDISAKLTVAKNLTKDFNFAFSQNLKGSRSQAWIATYNPYRSFLMRAVNETDQRELRLELRQDLRVGGGPALPKRTQPRMEAVLGNVTFTGADESQKVLERQVSKVGKPFNAYRMNDDVKKLEAFYSKNNFLDVKVRGHRTPPTDGHIDVEYSIVKGPEILLMFEGAAVPSKVKGELRKIWVEGFADAPSLRAVENRLLKYYRDEGFLNAKVSHREDSGIPNTRRFIFTIVQGAKFKEPDWRFEGTGPIEIKDTAGDVLAAPESIRQRIEYDLQKKGFLAATASVPELIVDGMAAHFKVKVDAGLQYMVGQIDFSGNTYFDPAHLRKVILLGATNVIPKEEAGRPPDAEKPLKPFPFTSEWIETARQRLTAEYWQQGFNDLRITPSTSWDRSSPRVTIAFAINEGERQLVEHVDIDGAMLTDMSYINRQFQFKQGDPVDYSRINLTRKKLYDTGLFKRVEIDVVPESNGYSTRIRLNENAPWRFRYGFAAANRMETSDRVFGVTADATYGNLFGRGISVGSSVKAQQKERDVRVFGSLPEFLGRKVTTTGTLFRTRDRSIPETTQYFVGLTGQQQWRLSDYYVLTYDYSYQRIHALGPRVSPVDDAVTDFRYNISRFNVSVTRDTRDDILNATRGKFFANSFELAPPGLGTTFKYVKNFAQYFTYRKIRKNLVWASGYRAGLAKGLGSPDLVPAEQFLAGGGTTLRGFRQDQLSLEPGNGLLVVNQELRFPIFWKFGGAAFFDVGNIYRNVKSVRPWDVRYSPGFGIRIATPLLLLRVDVGLNLSIRSGEPPRRIVFGIGQAF